MDLFCASKFETFMVAGEMTLLNSTAKMFFFTPAWREWLENVESFRFHTWKAAIKIFYF